MALNHRQRRSLTLIVALLAMVELRVDGSEPVKLPKELDAYLTKELVAIFDAGKLVMPADTGYPALEYRLFTPKSQSTQPASGYPLIIFFNGHGEIQMNFGDLGPLKHLQATIFRDPELPENYPFYLMAIRCPKDIDNNWLPWFHLSSDDKQPAGMEPIEAAMLALDEVAAAHPIDRNRVSLLGISSGGAAAWELAMRYPDRFSAIAPTACDGGDTEGLERLRDLPIWAFHSTGDEPEPILRVVDELQSMGSNAHLTLVDSDKHDCWTAAFQNHDLLSWLLAQSRDQVDKDGIDKYLKSVAWFEVSYLLLTSKGRVQAWSELWPRAVPVLAIVAAVLLYRRESRQRQLQREAGHETPAAQPSVQGAINAESST